MASHKGGTCASFVVLQDQKKGVKKKTQHSNFAIAFLGY
jgi:hypothetical protein